MAGVIFLISVEELAQREKVINYSHFFKRHPLAPNDLSGFLEHSRKDRIAVLPMYSMYLCILPFIPGHYG